ncbi:MAG TPA: DUF2959 domain-containing protein [Marinobacter sp.]|uniref:DUF2959 domain-containing protein n=2 Tax=root TaxID=1 RepID=A0A831R760_9GAMM|nr:DUF2959 domain-containing protein [Marinobacter antarcticus]HDZ38085.1 DUF2959 domain-containing protein [Marinobacter sp.]HEA53605.1 DUF2959 domain-containing protein [Marinobacter antarcticus]
MSTHSRTVSVVTRLTGLFCLLLVLGGCSTVYYSTMEKLGVEKRDILVDRVGDARDAQSDARETFRSSLERFQSVVDTPETGLQEKYDVVSEAYDNSLKSANNVRDRIDGVEDVSEALFDEWEDELDLYESASLRNTSKRKLDETRELYSSLIARMHQVEKRMDPVLAAFEDQVLFLKHNLNAQAIGALENELGQISRNVDSLIRDMEASIAESEAFIQRFREGTV